MVVVVVPVCVCVCVATRGGSTVTLYFLLLFDHIIIIYILN